MLHPALFPLVLALIGGTVTLRQILFTRRLQRTGVKVLGQVVHQREVSSRKGNYFVPTIRFTTCFGQLIEAESAGHSTTLDFFDGDEVLVCYDPTGPKRFLVVQELELRRKYGQMAIAAFMCLLAWVSILK